MKTPLSLRIACLLAVVVWSRIAIAVEVEQSTSGPCSSAINGNDNTVNCSDVDPRAVARLNELLKFKKLTLKQKKEEANQWARKYNELNAQFEQTKKDLAAKNEDTTLVQRAQNLLHEGKLEEARKIYDRLIASDETNVGRAAERHFVRAIIFALQFRMVDALADYAQAYQYRPHDPRYASEYGRAAYIEGQYAEAKRGWTGALQLYRDLAAYNPGAYRSYVAAALNDLVALYSKTGQLAKAEKADSEALTIYRDLATGDPTAYRPDLVRTLNNRGNVYHDTGRLAKAERPYNEALTIYRDLVTHDPAAYRPDLARTLDNLGSLYSDTDRFVEAEKAYSEALTIYRDLAAHDAVAYRPDVALTLNNLGALYRDTGRLTEAENSDNEALTIYRDLATSNPGAYRPKVAMTLTNLGNVYYDAGWPDESEKAYNEALAIRRNLAAHDPGAYRPGVALTLNNLGDLYSDTGRLADADKVFSEALTIYRDLVASNPAYATRIASLTKVLAELRTKSSSSRANPAPPLVSSSHKS